MESLTKCFLDREMLTSYQPLFKQKQVDFVA